ncbi:helix-turn-helix transcriptional regulator [Fructobacillus cardui]|uniref:helix-turn-helix transcriptional regulator n=1 Tax=Fructobacillus cardui TaxID=2893170 RepID=UPI0025997D9B|nr:helix-turn-helix transcriptional regulator [uncultured Fructobacillus sp.]CAK1226170.1 DNA-binding transcriptional regulator [Fructobacillus cardui]
MKNNIRDRRKALKLSQDELARLTNVTRQTINAIENNKYDPTLVLAFNLAVVLNTTVQELFIHERLQEKEND